jgi:hypothetical protein
MFGGDHAWFNPPSGAARHGFLCSLADTRRKPAGRHARIATPQRIAAAACGQRADVEKMLKEQYGERAMAHGLAHSGAVAEIFTSPKGTWTIIATSPNGISCMIGSGESWKTTLAADETI